MIESDALDFLLWRPSNFELCKTPLTQQFEEQDVWRDELSKWWREILFYVYRSIVALSTSDKGNISLLP